MNNRNPAIPLSKNEHLLRWVEKMTELCKPDSLHWVDGSKEEYDSLCKAMVDNGTFIELNQKLWPGCFYARSNPGDVARVEDRTFICSNSRDGAGPTNNWVIEKLYSDKISTQCSSPAKMANWSRAPAGAAENIARDSSCGSRSRDPRSRYERAVRKLNWPALLTACLPQYSCSARRD